MKRTKKILSLALCAILLVSATVATTVAYLTSQDAVTNTFTVGKVAIDLDETDTDGTKTGVIADVTAEGRDKANAYKLYPGKVYTKDPIVHVLIDSEEAWLFVKVVNGLEAIESDNAEDEFSTIADQMEAKGWVSVENNIFAYPTKVNAGNNITVFENFKIDEDVTNEILATYKDASITVTAYAVQAQGFATYTAALEAAPFPAN